MLFSSQSKFLYISAYFFTLLIVIIGNNPTSAINEWCKEREDCTRMVGNVVCHRGICNCKEFNIHVEFFGREECLPIALNGPGSSCKDHRQCTMIMDSLSRCNKGSQSQGTCECYDVHQDGWKKAVYANGKCIYQKVVGERCQNDEECIASIGRNSRCKDEKCTKSVGKPSSANGILPPALTAVILLIGLTLFGSRSI